MDSTSADTTSTAATHALATALAECENAQIDSSADSEAAQLSDSRCTKSGSTAADSKNASLAYTADTSASTEDNNECDIAQTASTTDSSEYAAASGFASTFPDNASLECLAVKVGQAECLTYSFETSASAFDRLECDLDTRVSDDNTTAQEAANKVKCAAHAGDAAGVALYSGTAYTAASNATDLDNQNKTAECTDMTVALQDKSLAAIASDADTVATGIAGHLKSAAAGDAGVGSTVARTASVVDSTASTVE